MANKKIDHKDYVKLVEALKIINTKAEPSLSPALEELLGDNPDIEKIRSWVDPTKNTQKGNDPYKVARCLAWYIVTKCTDINKFDNIKLKVTFHTDK